MHSLLGVKTCFAKVIREGVEEQVFNDQLDHKGLTCYLGNCIPKDLSAACTKKICL